MGTFTAQILVGGSHPNHGGIIPSHMLLLSENSRPAWVLNAMNIWGDKVEEQKAITWIPTIENMLEDALLMIGLYVVKDQELVNAAGQVFCNKDKYRVELYEDITKEDLQRLYQRNQQLTATYSIAVSTFGGSTIDGQLKVLEKYNMGAMVLKPQYQRYYSQWEQATIVKGSL